MEEGREATLEMTPLTQTSSLDDDGIDEEETLAEFLGGSSEESASAKVATMSIGDAGDKGAISATTAKNVDGKAGNAREGTSSDATNSFGDRALENSRSSIDGYDQGARCKHDHGEGAADHDNDETRFWQSSPATSGSSPSSRKGRGALGFDSEVRRGVSKGSGSGRESGGDFDTKTKRSGPDEGALESFHEEDQTTSAVWRECLVPIKLLREKRVRGILFVYGVYSVR